MKYIRTKDKVYEVESDIEYVYKNDEECHLLQAYKDVYEEYGEETNWTDLGEIIKQADTIEELCDEFVLFDYDREIRPSIFRFPIPLQKYVVIHKDYEIYAAIWTEWGLKYVAKMNEKGELELL